MARGVTVQRPFFHLTPDEHGPTDGFLQSDVPLEVLDPVQTNLYWRVRLADGREGWVHSELVRIIPDQPVSGGGVGGGARAFASVADVDGWAMARFGQPFIAWFNANQAGKIATSQATRRAFEAVCNDLPHIFGGGASLEQLLCLLGVMVKETGGSLTPGAEKVNFENHPTAPGIAYAFNAGSKASYNKAPNRTALSLFHDPLFMDRFTGLPMAAQLRNTQDVRWEGQIYPVDAAPVSTDPAISGVILECDFFKFRGRGFIQTTWRSNYVALIQFVQNTDHADPVLRKFRQAWAGRLPDEVATTSTNAEWNELFENTNYVVACEAIRLHSRDHFNYLNVSSDFNVFAAAGATPGSAFHFGKRVNGGDSYAADLRSRVVQLRSLVT